MKTTETMFEDLLKKYESKLYVQLYPVALVKDFMKKALDYGYERGLKTKINTTTISDCPVKDDQLTEAKKIIRGCMGQMAFHDCEYTDAYKKAEAFLKE